jgi:hypothetical protein
MTRRSGKEKKPKRSVTRRDFIKQSATAGTAAIAGVTALKTGEAPVAAEELRTVMTSAPVATPATPATPAAHFVPSLHVGYPIGDRNFFAPPQEGSRPESTMNRPGVLFAMGDTLIPSAPGDPGYRDLEWYGITNEVSRRLEISDEDLETFDKAGIALYQKRFSELSENQRADYFNRIIQGTATKDEAAQKKLRDVYTHVREVVFTIYYQNFPENSWPRDGLRVPLLKPGDKHQITNPSTPAIFTGWDLAGYAGPLTWEEEERRRNYFRKIKWQE